MKHIVLFDKETGKLNGYVKLGNDRDLMLYPEALEIPIDHPAIHEQDKWRIADGKLIRKC